MNASMDSEESALVASIYADADNDAPRLVYADWLEQQGRLNRAELIRLQCRLAQAQRSGVSDSVDQRLLHARMQELLWELSWMPPSWPWDERPNLQWVRGMPEGLQLPDWDTDKLRQLPSLMPHLRSISVDRPPESSQDLQLLADLKNLRQFRLSRSFGSNEACWQGLAQLPKLQSVDLSWCSGVTDEAIQVLLQLKDLQELDLSQTHISDPGALAKLTGLRTLKLAGCTEFTAETLPAHLDRLGKALGQVSTFSLEDCPALTDDALVALVHGQKSSSTKSPAECTAAPLRKSSATSSQRSSQRLGQLRELNLSYCKRLTDRGVALLAGLPSLRLLDLRYCVGINGTGLAGLDGLESLELGDCVGLTDIGLAQLCGLTNLRHLGLRYPRGLTTDGLRQLFTDGSTLTLPKLRSVDLRGCWQATNGILLALGNLPELRRLDLQGCRKLTDRGVAQLGRRCQAESLLQQLEWLSLAGTAIGQKGVEQLSGLPKLRSLSLNDTNIGNRALASLADCRQLRSLYLTACAEITDKGLNHLQKLAGLRWLSVRECPLLTKRGLERLQHSLPQLSVVAPSYY